MLRRDFGFVLLMLGMLLGLGGCTGEAPREASGDHTFEDGLGRRITIDRPIERVLTLAPNLTEIVFAAGAGGTMAGRSTADDYPPGLDTLPRFGVLPIDVEAIAALRPDLVLASAQVNNPRDAETLAALGIPTAFFASNDLEDVLQSIRAVGRLLGTADRAEAAADSLERRIAALRRRTQDLEDRPLVLFLIGDEPLFAFGRGSYIHDLIRLAGGRSVTAEIDTQAPVLSDEYVLQTRPEVIIGAWGDDYDLGRLRRLHPTWANLPALHDDRVYSLDPDLLLRPGPRLVEGAYRMARVLHPSLFEDALPEAP